MDKPKLNYRFHNPNATDDEFMRVLLRVCIEANRKKAEQAIRECAMADGVTYRVIAVDNQAKVADIAERTLFKMPKGEYEGKNYFISNEYIKREKRECVLELPEDFEIELCGNERERNKLTIDEFIKAVSGKTARDYESPYKRPIEIAAEERARNRPKRRVSSSQNSK